jgi:hypothetical protein
MRVGSSLAHESRTIDHVASPFRRPIDRAYYLHSGRVRDLERLGASVAQSARISNGTRVLVLALRMWTHHTAYESLIAHALQLRGHDVALLTCGGGQPICEVGWGREIAPRPCDRCAFFTDRVARAGRFHHLRLADDFPWGAAPDRAPKSRHEDDSVLPRDAGAASVAWFTKSAEPLNEPNGVAVENDFAVAVEAVEHAFTEVLKRYRPDVVFALNGLFAAERTVCGVAAKQGVRVVTYERAARKGTIVLAQNGAAPDMEMDALAADQSSRPLSAEQSSALDTLLAERTTGTSSHERYFREQEHGADAVRASLGLGRSTRIVSAFSNLAWDTALLGRDLAFASQFDWLAEAARIVGGLPDTALVIRVHPAEKRWGTSQPTEQELRRRLGALPANVVVIRPDEALSSYGLMAVSDLALCYTSTVGLEAAVRGIAVGVAGSTHYRGRGFTADIDGVADLERLIAEPFTMTPEQVELARRYAFAFFFRRMIPFGLVHDISGRLGELPTSADELMPGRDVYLDFVCDRIIDGGDVFLPPALALG